MIHHLNCGSFRPPVIRRMVAHCLLVERDRGLLLVDAGLGTDAIVDPLRLAAGWRAMTKPVLAPAETALAQVRALGHDPADVRDIVLTHLDIDHAGGIADFPHARVHVHAAELEAARHPRLSERGRYLRAQWAHGPTWVAHPGGGDEWFGFGSVTTLDDGVVLVPLPGHTRGHQGVAVARPGGGWLLHAGDAYFHRGDKRRPREVPRPVRVLQTAFAADNRGRSANLERLQELHATHGEEVTVFCAHDPVELEALRTP